MEILELFAVGASLTGLTAWGLNQYGKLSENSLAYDVLFLASSSVLLLYAYLTDALPFMIVNGGWVAVSLVEVVKDLTRKKNQITVQSNKCH